MENTPFKLSSFHATWNAHLTRSIESVLDIAHLAYVHKKTIGRKTKAESTNYKLEGTLDQFIFSNGDAYLLQIFHFYTCYIHMYISQNKLHLYYL
ncbi:hypothetical protein OCF64_24715 [Bacillus wiedmannii]|nr:hypothetical protein [Bacillus wiedmannii]MCU5684960.1 hypothetical protein [Bacillus wiedmannii]